MVNNSKFLRNFNKLGSRILKLKDTEENKKILRKHKIISKFSQIRLEISENLLIFLKQISFSKEEMNNFHIQTEH